MYHERPYAVEFDARQVRHPLAAAVQGRTIRRRGDIGAVPDRAGHFAVITADDGASQAYMHMQRKPVVAPGDRVEPRAPLGAVGESGSAQGCHLRYELWTVPGWYPGGEPIDPRPMLQQGETGA